MSCLVHSRTASCTKLNPSIHVMVQTICLSVCVCVYLVYMHVVKPNQHVRCGAMVDVTLETLSLGAPHSNVLCMFLPPICGVCMVTFSLLLTYLLTRVLLEQLTGLQLVKKFPAFHGTLRFITALTSVRHLSLSWASPIQSIYPHPTYWRSVLILSTHLRRGLPSGLFPSCFPIKTLYTPLSSPIRATCPAHLILLDFVTRTILGDVYKSFSSTLCDLLHSPVTSSLLGPNILLNSMFSNTLRFLSSRNVSDQVSHPYKTTGKTIVLYILIFKFLDSNLEDKRFCTE